MGLDVGCGDGRLTALLCEDAKHMTGVDNQKIAIDFAKLIFHEVGIKNASLQTGDATKLPFKDCSFDFVTCFDMIEHVPRESGTLVASEICRVAKSEGKIFLTTPNNRELRGRIFGHKVEEKHYYEYNMQELRNMFRSHLKDITFKGIYIPVPLPRAEHFANIVLIRDIFSILIKSGKNYPSISHTLLMQGTKK